MPQAFVCKWLLTMGIMAQLSSKGTAVGIAPVLPPQAPHCDPFLKSQKAEYPGFYLFMTPGYENKKYPNNTDCIRILKAPSTAKVISLDFRDAFHIEPSPGCEYDYLEIRDGPYAFSPALEKGKPSYCGASFPLDGRKILSSGQFLWLRFRSDGSIQHEGVKAVYEFVDQTEVSAERRSRPRCRVAVKLDTGSKMLTDDSFSQNYISERVEKGENIDCTFDIISPSSTKIYVHFDQLEFLKGPCPEAFIELYDGFTASGRKPGMMEPRLCAHKDGKTHVSTFNRLVFRAYSKSHKKLPRFTITVTSLSKAPCGNGRFDCGDGHCIAPFLRCNDKYNCPNKADEDCKKPVAEPKKNHEDTEKKDAKKTDAKDDIVPYHYIILGTIGALLCVFILICMFITIRQRRIDLRNRRREELLRRSSEAQCHFQQQQPQQKQPQQFSQSPHSLRRDLNTPSSLEGNRLLEFTGGGGGGRTGPGETASLGRLNKQNGAVLMGGTLSSGGGLKQMGPGPSSSSGGGQASGLNPGLPSSSIFYDPRTVHSSRVGKYLSVPNPSGGGTDEEEVCLDSPIEPIVGQHGAGGGGGSGSGIEPPGYASQQPRCKIHGEIYQREASLGLHQSAHQPIIHRSDSAPSKAFFRARSATPPPPSRSGANTPTAAHHLIQQESPPPHPHLQLGSARTHRIANFYPHGPNANAATYHHADDAQRLHQSPYYSARLASSPAPAYSLHNLSSTAVGTMGLVDDDDGPPCICRHHETLQPMMGQPRESHPPPVVRQTSLGTPRSLRRKVYET